MSHCIRSVSVHLHLDLFIQLVGSTDCGVNVTQFHFTAWPDHGVPDYATLILAFHRRVKKQHKPSEGPMLVHCRYRELFSNTLHVHCICGLLCSVGCSAGVGRTGTLITIDCVMDQIQKEGVVDIAGIIKKLRNQRMKMVQSPVCVCVFLCVCV